MSSINDDAEMDNDNILRDRIRDECIRRKLEVAPIDNKMREQTEIVWACAMQHTKYTNKEK